MPLVYNKDEKAWRCVDPTNEELDELIEIGKNYLIAGFSKSFMEDLINKALAEQEEFDTAVDSRGKLN